MKTFALINAAMMAVPALLVAQNPTFAGVPWGASRVAIEAALAEKPYTFTEKDEDGDLRYSASLLGYPAAIYFVMSPAAGLQKVQVGILVPDSSKLSEYRTMKAAMTSKYGTPTTDIHAFLPPFVEGDGRENEAIKTEKAKFQTYWFPDGNADHGGVAIQIVPPLMQIIYEGPGWDVEYKRREKDTRVF